MSSIKELDSSTEILEGIISVRAAIEAESRTVSTVYVDLEKYKKRDRKITAFVSFLKSKGIKPELCERGVIDAFVMGSDENAGCTHGGVAASCGARKYSAVDDILEKTAEEKSFCVYLDGVEDPYNLGYAYRSLYAAGASGIILPDRERFGASGVLARSSAGASEHLASARFTGFDNTEERLSFVNRIKKSGLALCCAAVSHDSVSVFNYDGGFPMILFIGGEKRGISPEYIDNADKIVHIPYANSTIRYSLPTATVAAVMGFELMNSMRKENS